jgi:hypothetical protein
MFVVLADMHARAGSAHNLLLFLFLPKPRLAQLLESSM